MKKVRAASASQFGYHIPIYYQIGRRRHFLSLYFGMGGRKKDKECFGNLNFNFKTGLYIHIYVYVCVFDGCLCLN